MECKVFKCAAAILIFYGVDRDSRLRVAEVIYPLARNSQI